MIQGTYDIYNCGDCNYDVMFVRHDVMTASLKPKHLHGIEELKNFMDSLACPMTDEQIDKARSGKPIDGFSVTVIDAEVYQKYFLQ